MREYDTDDEDEEQPRRRHTVSGGDRDGVGAVMAAAEHFDSHAVGNHEPAIFLPPDLAKEQDGAAENGGVRILDHYAGRREPTRSRSWEYMGSSRDDGGSGEGGGSGGQGEGYRRGRDDIVVSDNSFSRSSVAAAGGEDDYNGTQYEQDLEQAVAMLEIDSGRGGVGGVVRWGQDDSSDGRDLLNKSSVSRGDGGRISGDHNFPQSRNSTLDESRSGDLGRGHRMPRFNGSSAAGGTSSCGNGVDRGVHRRVESGTSGEDGDKPAGGSGGGNGGSGVWGNSRARRLGHPLASDLGEGRLADLAGGDDDMCGGRGLRPKHSFAFTDFPGGGGRGDCAVEERGTGDGNQEGGEWVVVVLQVSECYPSVFATHVSSNAVRNNRRPSHIGKHRKKVVCTTHPLHSTLLVPPLHVLRPEVLCPDSILIFLRCACIFSLCVLC